jgi:glyoxylase-like metal-dependent hydrolase (beta-lactamase superfamily II)
MPMAAADTWRELAPGVFVMAWKPFRLNVGLVLGQERALLIDTGASWEAGRDIVKLAKKVTDLPLGAVNSHSHFDHCFGNGALEADVIWSHRLCAEHLRWDGVEQQREVIARLRTSDREIAQQISESPIVSAGCLLDDEVELDLGERVVALLHPGRGHTDNDVVAWIADCRVLFAGDLVRRGPLRRSRIHSRSTGPTPWQPCWRWIRTRSSPDMARWSTRPSPGSSTLTCSSSLISLARGSETLVGRLSSTSRPPSPGVRRRSPSVGPTVS